MSLDPDLLPRALWDNFKLARQMTHFLNPFNVMNPSGGALVERERQETWEVIGQTLIVQ